MSVFMMPLAKKVTSTAAAAITGTKFSQQASQDILGYDFIGLLVKLVFIVIFGAAIQTYVRVVNGASSAWVQLLDFFGAKIPTYVPDQLSRFVMNGYGGLTFWDVIKGVLIAVVTYEMNQYYNKSKPNQSAGTIALFSMMVSFLALITIPDLFRRLKENGIVGLIPNSPNPGQIYPGSDNVTKDNNLFPGRGKT